MVLTHPRPNALSWLMLSAVVLVSAIGAIYMKTLAARVLKVAGFRRVLFLNALLASAILCAICGPLSTRHRARRLARRLAQGRLA